MRRRLSCFNSPRRQGGSAYQKEHGSWLRVSFASALLPVWFKGKSKRATKQKQTNAPFFVCAWSCLARCFQPANAHTATQATHSNKRAQQLNYEQFECRGQRQLLNQNQTVMFFFDNIRNININNAAVIARLPTALSAWGWVAQRRAG